MSPDRSKCVRCRKRLGSGDTKVCAHGDTHILIGDAPYAGVLCQRCALRWSPGYWPDTPIPRVKIAEHPRVFTREHDHEQLRWDVARWELTAPVRAPPTRKRKSHV